MKSALLALFVVFGLSSCIKQEGSEDADSGSSGADKSESSSGKSEYKQLRDEIAELKKAKKVLDGKIEDHEDSQKESTSLAQKEIEIAGELEQVRKYRDALNAHEKALDETLNQWRTATRDSFKGVRLPGIETVKGERYAEVTITSIEDESITFEHSGGMATVPVIELPLSLRKNVIHEATVLAGKAAQ